MSASFRREAHVPLGGPDGGDGGHGGSVELVCDDSLRDLQAFRRRAHFKAPRARHGEGSNRIGADGGTLEVKVPPGTQVTLEDGTVHDLVVPGTRIVVARGGTGGRGNKRFATSTRQAPRFAERGLPGEESWIELQLKLMADVGLVGLPNAGKSSLLSRITRAAPKVADYPFTTLEPVLGTLETAERQLVIADIPGLIEGASDGAGLGHDFLAHVERTRLLVHVLDLAPLDGSDPVANHATIEAELAAHDPRLAALPRLLALSKADLVAPERRGARGRRVARAARRRRPRPRDLERHRPGPGRARPRARPPRAAVRARPAGGGRPGRRGPGRAPHVPPRRPPRLRGRTAAATACSSSRARRSSGCSPATTSTTRRRWRTSRRAWRGWASCARLEDAGFEPGDDVEIAGVLFELDPS